MIANAHRTAPTDGELRVALDDLKFTLERALVATSNLERLLPGLTASASLVDRIDELLGVWRDANAAN